MTKARESEKKVIEKSLIAIEYSIEGLGKLDIDQSIEMYNTVLQAFESLQKLYMSYKGKDMTIPEKLTEIEVNHKKVIERFEEGNIAFLTKMIKTDIYEKYQELQQLSQEFQSYENLGIDTTTKYFKWFKDAGVLDNINQSSLQSIQSYWKNNFGENIDPYLHIAYEKLTGRLEPRVIPQYIVWNEIIPYLNSRELIGFYSDKNVYDLLITSEYHPEIMLKRVRGQYFNSDNETISRGQAFKEIIEVKEDIVVKQSLSDDGKGIGKLKYSNYALYYNKKKFTLKEIEEVWGDNFLIQKVIKQHPVMASPHKYSVNTIRMVTLRWNDSINYLMSFARFGADYSMKDNAGQGGLCVGILKDGTFQPYAIGSDSKLYYKHPTTGFDFDKLGRIPRFDRFIKFVKTLHNRILHHNYVSWDIAVDTNGEPVFIEMNFFGAAWLYQLACQQPLFGEFTEELLEKVAKNRQKNLVEK